MLFPKGVWGHPHSSTGGGSWAGQPPCQPSDGLLLEGGSFFCREQMVELLLAAPAGTRRREGQGSGRSTAVLLCGGVHRRSPSLCRGRVCWDLCWRVAWLETMY